MINQSRRYIVDVLCLKEKGRVGCGARLEEEKAEDVPLTRLGFKARGLRRAAAEC